MASLVVLPKTKALGVGSETIASLGAGIPLLVANYVTVDSSHGCSPERRYLNFVEDLTIAGPIRY